MSNENFIKDYFRAWQERDWEFVDKSLTDDFTFTSPYDDHLDKQIYRQKCWDTVKEIAEFKFVGIAEKDNEIFVRYIGEINQTAVQNTEHFVIENGKIRSVTVFFGRPE